MKKLNKTSIIIILLIAIIVICMAIYIGSNIYVNWYIKNSSTVTKIESLEGNSVDLINVSNVMLRIFEDGKELIYFYTFDENDICINCNCYYKGMSEQELKELLNQYSINPDYNAKIENDIFTFNRYWLKGQTKSQIKELHEVNQDYKELIEF